MSEAAYLRPRPTIRRWEPPDVRDSVAPVPIPMPQPIAAQALEPRLTDADLADARAMGLRDGAVLAEQSATHRTALALEGIEAELRGGSAAAGAVARCAADALGAVALQALIAAFPLLENRFGPSEVAALVATLLPGLSREPTVRVRIAAGAAAALAAVLGRLPDPERARIQVEADETLGPADLRVAWRDGAATRDATSIRAAVLDALCMLGGDTTNHEGDT